MKMPFLLLAFFILTLGLNSSAETTVSVPNSKRLPGYGAFADEITDELYSSPVVMGIRQAGGQALNEKTAPLSFRLSASLKGFELTMFESDEVNAALKEPMIRYCELRRMGFTPPFIIPRLAKIENGNETRLLNVSREFRKIIPGIQVTDIERMTEPTPSFPFVTDKELAEMFIVKDKNVSLVYVHYKESKVSRIYTVDSKDNLIAANQNNRLRKSFLTLRASHLKRPHALRSNLQFWKEYAQVVSDTTRGAWQPPSSLNPEILFD